MGSLMCSLYSLKLQTLRETLSVWFVWFLKTMTFTVRASLYESIFYLVQNMDS